MLRNKIILSLIIASVVIIAAWLHDVVTHNKQRYVYLSMLSMAVYFSGDYGESKRGDSTESVISKINEGRDPGIKFSRSHVNPFPELLPDWEYDFAEYYYGPDGPLIVAHVSYWLKPDKVIVMNWSGSVAYGAPGSWKRKDP